MFAGRLRPRVNMSRKSDLQFHVNPLFPRSIPVAAPPRLQRLHPLPVEKSSSGLERCLRHRRSRLLAFPSALCGIKNSVCLLPHVSSVSSVRRQDISPGRGTVPRRRPAGKPGGLPEAEDGKCVPHLTSFLFSPLELGHDFLLILICPRGGLSPLLMSLLNVSGR